MTDYGFLGLGIMGGAMARRLLDAGHDVRCLARNPQRLEDQPWRDDVEVVAHGYRTEHQRITVEADDDVSIRARRLRAEAALGRDLVVQAILLDAVDGQGRPLASGVYLARLETGEVVSSIKITLAR